MTDTTEFCLPELADQVTEVKLTAWLKAVGDYVEVGEPIAEVETDKTNVELEAPVSGVLRVIHVAAGTEGLGAGAVLALIAAASEQSDEGGTHGAAPALTGNEVVSTAGSPVPVVAAHRRNEVVDELPPVGSETDSATVPATPVARKMAAVAGLDLAGIRGTGRGGRIGKEDVDRALAERREGSSVGASVPASPPVGVPAHVEGPFQDHELTAMRRVTATRMQQSKQTVPHFYLRVDCAVDAALGLLASAKRQEPEVGPTLTDFVICAAAHALRLVPGANAAWADGVVRMYDSVDVALAVNTPTGLIAPVIRQADRKELEEIAAETRTLAAGAREGTLLPADYAGGTFTISNLGMYGVESLYAIVNPPQSCVLGIGAALSRPVAFGQEVRVARMMACTLSADHRVIDGALGAELLAAIKDYIERAGS